MGNQALKKITFKGRKWRIGVKKLPKLKPRCMENRSEKESHPNPAPSSTPSTTSINSSPSNVKGDEQTVPQLSDGNLVLDSVIHPRAKTCVVPQLTTDHCEHIRREWSVSDLVNDFPDFEQISSELRNDLLATIRKEASLAYPEFFYDFCMVSSEEDEEKARALTNELCAKFQLTGCMLYDDDFFTLGGEIFGAYENMMERSTKIFFYISDNFNANRFCKRIQSGAVFQGLMSKAQQNREKCVPIFPNGLCRVPLALSGIGGLEIPSVKITEQRIKITYTEDVRNQRLRFERINNEKKKEFILDCLNVRVRQCLETSERQKLDDSLIKENSSSHQNGKFTSSQSCSQTTLINEMRKLIETSTSAPVVSSSEVNISSSSAHIGHNITLMIYPPPTEEPDSSSDSDDF